MFMIGLRFHDFRPRPYSSKTALLRIFSKLSLESLLSILLKARPIHCVITAGPTREYFDPVRFLSNPSSGKMGYALAQAALELGCSVDLVSGPVALAPPEGVSFYSFTSAEDLHLIALQLFDKADLFIMTAAVCDQKPACTADHKLKKDGLGQSLAVEPTVDVLASLGARKERQILVGFAAETQAIEENALKKLEGKNLDWIVANPVGGLQGAFESDENIVTLLGRGGDRLCYGPEPKTQIAAWLMDKIMLNLSQS